MATTAKSWLPAYVTRRRFIKGTAAGAGAAMLIACGGGDGGGSGLKLDDSGSSRTPGTVWLDSNDWKLEDETKDAVRGGTYRTYREEELPGGLDPIPQVNSATPTADHTYELLLARNRGPGVQPGSEAYNNPIGALAESWEISADATQYTFRMRPNVKFQNVAPVNGRVMDIDDWKTTHERYLATGVYRNALPDAGLDKFEFPDNRTMVIKFKVPYVPMIDRVWDSTFLPFIMPKELNANPELAQSKAIGTGFKIFERHQPSIGLEFRKHPEYWGGDPFIDRWTEAIVPEYANRYAQFISQNFVTFGPTARDVLKLKQDAAQAVIVGEAISEFEVTRHKIGRTSPTQQAWKDERVRIAMRKSINFKGIGEFLSNKAEFGASGIPIETRTMTHVMQNPAYWLDPEKGELGDASKNFLYDLAEAKRLTAAAGFTEPIDLPYYINTQGTVPQANQVVIDSLKESGVFRLDVRALAANDFRVTINVDGKYDGTQQESGASGNDIDYVMFRDYHSSRVGGVAFPDAKVDQLCDAQRREPDFQKRIALLKELQLYLAQKMYMIPGRDLYTTLYFRWPWLHNTGWGGISSAATGRSSQGSPDLGSHLHWLDKDMPNRDRA
jgi:ABC-type transport system substrate-binding protein